MITVGVFNAYGSQVAVTDAASLEEAVQRWIPDFAGAWAITYFGQAGAEPTHAEVRHPITNNMEWQFMVLGEVPS